MCIKRQKLKRRELCRKSITTGLFHKTSVDEMEKLQRNDRRNLPRVEEEYTFSDRKSSLGTNYSE